MPDALEKRIDVQVGLTRRPSSRSLPPHVCIVGIAPEDSPWLSEIFPDHCVRKTQHTTSDEGVEQLRFSGKSQHGPLPDISAHLPSRIRDAFRLLMAAGSKEVDVLLARTPGLLPWDLDRPVVSEMMSSFLGEMPGTLLVYPDAGGPWPSNRSALVSQNERMTRLIRTIRNFSQYWRDHFQLGVMDLVSGDPAQTRAMLLRASGHDVVLCQWSGNRAQLQRHGWRAACAALAGHLAAQGFDITQGVVGQKVSLGQGRHSVSSRAVQLGLPKLPELDRLVEDTCAVLELDEYSNVAEIMGTPTFRRPIGEWGIASVRTVKLIHQRLIQASDMFIFRPAHEIEATALAANIDLALKPFFQRGIVVGPDGEGPPTVRAGVVRNPSEPGLYVDLAAQVRPWCQQVSVRVMVKMGSQPLLSEQ